MKDFELKIKNPLLEDDDEDGGSSGGLGGQGVEFQLDDPWLERPMSPEELQMLEEHEQRQESHIKDAEDLKKAREQAKESRGEYSQAGASEAFHAQQGETQFKKHPLSDCAQFAGADNEVSPIPSDAETDNLNQDKAERLTLQLQHQNRNEAQPTMQPHNSPRPNPMGGM